MRILVLSQYWTPENGVPQRRWSWLSRILISEGHEVAVISPPPHYQRKISLSEWWKHRGLKSSLNVEKGPSGEDIFRSGYFPTGQSLTSRIFNQAIVAWSMLTMLRKNSPRIREFNPDLIIGTVPALPTAVVTQIAARLINTPYVIDLRDAWPDLLQNSADWNSSVIKRSLRERVFSKGPLQLLIKITQVAINCSLRNAEGIITTSEDLANHLKQNPMMMKKQKHIGVVRNVFPPKTNYLGKSKDETNSDSLHVLYAGTLGRAQKLENALEAVRIAQKRGFNVKLRLLGDGALWSTLKQIVDEGSADIEMRHKVSAASLLSYYDWADTALVHLADWKPLTMTIPSKTFELMSLRIHITAVVKGETARLIDELGVGVVVNPEDPEALAATWIALIRDRSKLKVPDVGKKWVDNQRNEVVPRELMEIVSGVTELDQG